MNQLLSTLRLSAIMIAMIGTAAHATTPGTITPEQDDTVQQDQNQNDDGFIEEDDQDNGQNQDDINGYGDEQDQDDNWGDDDQDQDQDDRRQGDGKKGQDDGKNGRDQDDGYDRGQDDGYDRGQDGKDYRPGKPGRDQGKKPRYDRRPRRLVETVNVYQQYFGGARFPLYMMVNNLQRFQGYRLVNVIINGSSDMGAGVATFCASQCTGLQSVGYYRTAYPIRTTGERINPNSAQWFLELRGNFWIESIQLEFVR